MRLARIPYGAVLETTVPAIGFRVARGTTTRVVSLLAEPLTEVLDWIEAVDLVRSPGRHGPLEVEMPGAILSQRGTWLAICSQVRLIPRSRVRPGTFGVVPAPQLARIRAAVRALLDV